MSQLGLIGPGFPSSISSRFEVNMFRGFRPGKRSWQGAGCFGGQVSVQGDGSRACRTVEGRMPHCCLLFHSAGRSAQISVII